GARRATRKHRVPRGRRMSRYPARARPDRQPTLASRLARSAGCLRRGDRRQRWAWFGSARSIEWGEDRETQEKRISRTAIRPATSDQKASQETRFVPGDHSRNLLKERCLCLVGRTRARTWDPLIKRHAATIDFSRESSPTAPKSDHYRSMAYNEKSNCEGTW